ncbi:protein NPGR1-like [Nymphaea colorata]|uniref:protein NPGR1-like n=1 Tax=Nymphaea colorata TaxID=210225 RepID=UPI00129D3F5B|nr:protein NPGR1-like [Nymphaea colorata]
MPSLRIIMSKRKRVLYWDGWSTREVSAGGISSRTLDWDAKFVDNYVEEEARALLGRLEYQRGFGWWHFLQDFGLGCQV